VSSPLSLRFGYGTNGFADHSLDQALGVIADLGYEGVALTLDHGRLDPFQPDLAERVRAVRRRLDALGLSLVVETGARYLLDPWRKHAPTLLHERGRELRADFLRRAVRIGAELGAEAVSFWSGVLPDRTSPERGWDLLTEACGLLFEQAEREGVVLGFEPEPGMLVENLAGYERLRDALGGPPAFGLTLDIGHCRCLEEESVADCVRRAAPHLVNVQIDDMRRGVHEHLEFGDGEIAFAPVLAALVEVGYRGLVAVELPRHSHSAPATARRSLAFLTEHHPRPPAPPPLVADRADGQAAGRAADLAAALDADLTAPGREWLRAAVARAAVEPSALLSDFPAAGRVCGRGPLSDPAWTGWTVDEAARTVLLAPATAQLVLDAYAHGDSAERRAVLRALPFLDLGEAALFLVEDALRTNDGSLVAAALGPAADRLDDDLWRQGVLKCLFLGIPLGVVARLDERADAELARMLLGFAHERVAAGRDVPAELWPLVSRYPELLSASPIHAELDSPVPTRAAAARRALAALR
jgi:L-ribulose-5-phosphate 3-epimerase